MNPTPEFVAIIQREREQDIEHDRLARLAARIRAGCDAPSLLDRIAHTLRLAPASC